MQFHVLFNNISVILGRQNGDIERLSGMKTRLRFERPPPQTGTELGPLAELAGT